MRVFLFFLVAVGISSRAVYCQAQAANPPAPQPLDSMEYYNQTKKPAISDPAVTEYAPTIQADGKTMLLEQSEKGKKYALYESRMENGTWGKPLPLTRVNSFGDTTDLIGGPSLSFDGNTMYYFRSVGMMGDHEIFFSERTRDGWSEPKNVGAPINSQPIADKNGNFNGGYEAFPSISADGSTLYFVRKNEQGPQDKLLRKEKETLFCLCIYKAAKDKEGKWMKPEKLPWPINQDCEKAPRIMADGRTLIFSSNRPGGKGGYDMYQSTLNELDEWSMPVPLNFVNTEKDDQLPSISAEGDLMYYTYNNSDIYSVVIPPKLRQFMNNIVQGYVRDEDTKMGIETEIVVTDALTSETVMKLESNPADGRYTLVLPVGKSFNIEYKKSGYSSFTQSLDLRDVHKYQEKVLDVNLFKTIKLTLNISDHEIYEPIPAEVKIREKGKNAFVADMKNNPRDGRAFIDLAVGKEYEIILSANHFKSEILEFNVSGLVIYRNFEKYIELVPEKTDVMVNVSDLVNNSKVKAKVVLKNKNRDEVIEVSGNQLVSLRAGDRYEVEVTSDQGYAFNSTVLDLSGGGAVAPLDVRLMKLERDAKLTLRDINFESNSVQLSDISYTELRRVIQLMKENPTLRVEVAAHTDDLGSENYNQSLSQQRAKSVANFLMENKIDPSRFEAKGYGESQAKVANDSETNRAINRRVELRILSI
ncbi:MAG: OmpA family protein [Cyclobacteriaceae bacterium]|nr:OmpA family protein [Cyclobacteriaceae bacterium]